MMASSAIKCLGAVYRRQGCTTPYAESLPLTIETVTIDPPKRGEVLVKVAAAGLCHSDLSVVNGDRPRPPPMLLGHESAGIVEQVGEGVTDLVPGDHVVTVFVPSCGCCGPCSEGRPALCEPGASANVSGTLLCGEKRLHAADGSDINHHIGVSAFAQYAVMSRKSVVKIDPAVPLVDAALFGCAVLTGVGAVVNTAAVRLGQTVAIVGIGGVGQASLIAAVSAGASRVVAIDISEEKLQRARELGATDTFNATSPTCVADVRAATSGGVDFALEMAGSPAALEIAYKVTRRGGTTITGGLPPPSSTLAIPIAQLVGEERTLKGSYIGSCVPSRDIPRYVQLYKQGRLPVNKLLSHKIQLSDINVALDRLREGKATRQVICFF
ncbi:Zn-alcohol dehydrogenase, catalytic subunit, mitochondrial [Pelomyxa schiedti]|nr:Zn-alcohol dehydrogenase, catalytic subunit, mitochondrial [Pelomyxa schiedti]